MVLDLLTTGQVLNGTVFLLNDFGLLPDFYMLEQWYGTHGVMSIIILIWTKTITLHYGQVLPSKSG